MHYSPLCTKRSWILIFKDNTKSVKKSKILPSAISSHTVASFVCITFKSSRYVHAFVVYKCVVHSHLVANYIPIVLF